MTDIAQIGFKADTSDLSKAEAALDSLAATGKKTEQSANQASAAIGGMSKPANQSASAIEKYISALRTQNETLGMTTSELRQYEAAQLGASDSQLKIVANLQSQINQYQKNAAAISAATLAEEKRASAVASLVNLMREQAATVGMTTRELALYKAAQLGATEEDKKAIIAASNKIEAYERASREIGNTTAAINASAGAMGNSRGVMQSFGYQIQDIVVQAQMGTSAFVILSQQGSQMAAAFGPSGAVFGAVIALAGVLGMVLAPALMDSKTNADKLAESMDSLSEAAERNEYGVLELTNDIKELAKQSEFAAKAQLAAVMIKSAEAIKLASNATADMIEELSGAGYGLYDVSDAMKELDKAFGYFGGGRSQAFVETVTEIGEKLGKSGKEAEILGTSVLEALKKMATAKTPEAIRQAGDYIIAAGQAAKLSDPEMAKLIMTVNKFSSEGITAAETAQLLADSLSDGTVSATTATDKIEELSKQVAIAKAEFQGGESAAAKLALAFELGLTSASQLTPELAAQVDELIKWRNAAKEAREEAEKFAEKMLKLDEAMQDRFDAEEELAQIEKDRIARKEEEIDAMIEPFEEGTKAVKEYTTLSEKAAERIESAFADAWLNAFDGFESVVDGMKNAFKRMLAEMAHMALTKPIMVSMGMGDMMGGGSAGTSAITSALGKNAMLASAASYLGPAAIVASLGAMLSKSLGGSGKNGALLGGLGGALLGSWKNESQSLGLSLSGGDITGTETSTDVRKKFFSNKRRTSTAAFDTSEIDNAFDAITSAISGAAKTFGINSADEVIKGFSASVNLDIKGKTKEEVAAAIQQWIGDTTSSLVSAVFGDSLVGLQREGEGAIDAVNRVTANMQVMQGVSKNLGLGFDLTGKAAMIAATNIVDLAGGIEQLSALTNQYYASFYTEAEQQQNLATQLAESFGKLNVSMPTTREGFRALVDGLDLTTESGQAMFAALMQLVPGMDQYLSALEAQRTASEQAAEAAQKEAEAKAAALKAQGLDLQIRLYEALGQSSEALALRRQMELEATDETLRAMLLQIYTAEDAAAAQRELASAQSKAAETARDAAQSAFGKLQDAAQREKDRLATELDLKLETIDKEREALTSQRDAVIAGYQAQGQAVQQYISQLEGISDVINNFIGSTGAAENPFKRLEQIFNETKAGLTPDQGELQSVLGAISSSGSAGFASATDQQRAMAIARGQAAGIGGVIGGRLAGARSQSEMIAQQIEDANKFYEAELLKLDEAAALAQKQHDEQVALIDKQLSDAEKQLNALLGVDDRILSMTDALAEFYASLESATAMQISKQDEQIAATYAVAAAVTDAAGFWAGPEQMAKPDTPMNTDAVGEPVTEEMVSLMKEILAASKANADHASKSASMLQEMTVGGLDVRVEA